MSGVDCFSCRDNGTDTDNTTEHCIHYPITDPLCHLCTHREFSEQHGITALVGEYRARCLFSKVWALRDAATNKVQMMLTDELEKMGIASCLPALSGESMRIEERFRQ